MQSVWDQNLIICIFFNFCTKMTAHEPDTARKVRIATRCRMLIYISQAPYIVTT